MKKENNKGITLIALVITIIIMIILVAVSVALAVKGDLFGNAGEGTDKTRIETEKEQLTEYVYGQYRENKTTKKVEVNLENVKEIVDGDKEKFDGASLEGDTLKVTGKSGEIYYVQKNGKISSGNKKENEANYYRFYEDWGNGEFAEYILKVERENNVDAKYTFKFTQVEDDYSFSYFVILNTDMNQNTTTIYFSDGEQEEIGLMCENTTVNELFSDDFDSFSKRYPVGKSIAFKPEEYVKMYAIYGGVIIVGNQQNYCYINGGVRWLFATCRIFRRIWNLNK